MRRVLFVFLTKRGLSHWPFGSEVAGVVEDLLTRFCGVKDDLSEKVNSAKDWVVKEGITKDQFPLIEIDILREEWKLTYGEALRFKEESVRFRVEHMLLQLSCQELASLLRSGDEECETDAEKPSEAATVASSVDQERLARPADGDLKDKSKEQPREVHIPSRSTKTILATEKIRLKRAVA